MIFSILIVISSLINTSCGPDHERQPVYFLPTDLTKPVNGTSGYTTKGVVWFAHLQVDRVAVEREIDLEVTDVNYTVFIVPMAFYTPVSPTGTALGETSIRDKTIIVVVNPYPGGLYLPPLRHEYHHVFLYNTTGDPDPKHADPSWKVYY